MKNKSKNVIILLLTFFMIFSPNVYAADYTIGFGGVGPGVGSIDLNTPISGFPAVTSQWNQPRSIGTNPHRGVDLRASLGTRVDAVCNGFVTYQSGTDLKFVCDVNGDGINNDSLEIFYDHLSAVGFVTTNAYVYEGTKIALSGDENDTVSPHLHFGTRTSRLGTTVWTRNEPYYRWTSNWNYGRDLDFISLVGWTSNTASIVAYEMALGIKSSLNSNSATLYHRLDGNSVWNSVQMTKSGDNYTYNLSNIYSNGQVINWMVKVDNPHTTSSYKSAFMIPKYKQPDSNPNATTNKYDYYKCTIGGSCTAIETP